MPWSAKFSSQYSMLCIYQSQRGSCIFFVREATIKSKSLIKEHIEAAWVERGGLKTYENNLSKNNIQGYVQLLHLDQANQG